MSEGELVTIKAKSCCSSNAGGAGRVYHCNTNGGIVTGDCMAMAYRHGVPLRDMEFVHCAHPASQVGLPGTGILMTEGCRSEGGIIAVKQERSYRHLQDYGMGPETPVGELEKYMELGPRDKAKHSGTSSVATPSSTHLVMWYTLTFATWVKSTCKSAYRLSVSWQKRSVNVDPAKEPIPIRPTVHYTMGALKLTVRVRLVLKAYSPRR
ncbi:FAD-binding protein [Vibrio lentus]|nr:FAD-binding protein [Vibrio lentus]